MDDTIQYLNTDLEISSPDDLTALASVLETHEMWTLLRATKDENALWHARFETDIQFEEPEPNIAAMVIVVESLDEPLRKA